MGILLQYNNATSYTWEDLLQNTGLTPDVLQSQITTILKAKVLVVGSGGLGKAASRYDLNEDFKSKKVRINLNIPGKSETKAENEETHKTIEEDRKLLIQVSFHKLLHGVLVFEPTFAKTGH
jgi:cullin 1